jgi:Ser/Thr protein kinase RdoA (MazF antagonist)
MSEENKAIFNRSDEPSNEGDLVGRDEHIAPDPEELERLIQVVAENSRPFFALSDDDRFTLINHSENMTYRIDRSNGEKLILRVHREGYQSYENIMSEIAWMKALQEDAGILTPQALAGIDGKLIQRVSAPRIGPRYCVLINWIDGEMPQETGELSDLLKPFTLLGGITARLHHHALEWQRPEFFQRQCWDFDGTIGDQPIWGRYLEGLGLTDKDKRLLKKCGNLIMGRLEQFGKSPDRFGLVHADLRLANLIIHQGNIRVIDFDDCGLSWFLYDIGAALSFMEDREDVPELVKAWLKGYLEVRSLSEDEITEIPTFIMLRRLTLLGWAASRGQTGGLASELGVPFTKGTCKLAQAYIEKFQ